MNDDVLGHLREARACLYDERDDPENPAGNSRALAMAITKIDEALLWRVEDLRLKAPTLDEASQ